MEMAIGIIAMLAFVLALHGWAAIDWLRYFRQEDRKEREKNKDGQIVAANAVPFVTIT
jgi:hypothetical protein